MNTLAIDPSLTSMGFSYGDNGENCGVLKPKFRGCQRLAYITCWLEELIEDQGNLDMVVLEGYAMGVKNSRVFDIGELGGILRLKAYNRVGRVLVVPPTVLKKVIAGKGNADKNEMMEAIRERYGLNIEQNDAADAYALWQLSRLYFRPSRQLRSLSADMKDTLKRCQYESRFAGE